MLFLKQVFDEAKKAIVAVLLGGSLGRMLCALLSRKWVTPIVECVKGQMRVDGVRVFDGKREMVSVESPLKSGKFFF